MTPVITEPTVVCVARPTVQMINVLAEVLRLSNTAWETHQSSDAQIVVEVAARTCYQSWKGGRPPKDHIENLLASGHGSTLEHCNWSFMVSGVSRSLSHELVRHRAGWAYSMLSQRYVDESEAQYVVPKVIADDPELNAEWRNAVAQSHAAYCRLSDILARKIASGQVKVVATVECDECEGLGDVHGSSGGSWTCTKCGGRKFVADRTAARKTARQAARSVLPNATETRLFVTANARALRHFFEQRASRHAEPEIRMFANRVWELVVKDAPLLFGDYSRVALFDETYELTTPWKKV